MWALDMVFVVGGNGGNAGADAIQCECQKAGIPCAVIGIPKSIDNDILLVLLFKASFPYAAYDWSHSPVLLMLSLFLVL